MHPNVCIHVGLPKTGTTFLQEVVFPNLSSVFYLGKQLALRDTHGSAFVAEQLALLCDSVMNESIRYREDEQRERFEKHVRPTLDGDRLNLLSEESFADGTADRGMVAQRFRDLFGPVKFLITIRRQQDLAQSMYSDFLKRITVEKTQHLNFDRWLETHWVRLAGSRYERSELIRFEFYDLATHYARLVGRENVGILLFEEMTGDPARFADRLARFLGADAAEIESNLRREPPEGMNTRASRSQRLAIRVESMTRMNGSVTRFLPRPAKSVMKAIIDRGGANTISVSPEWTEKIGNLCGSPNARLAAEWDLPLERYGYLL